MLKSCAACGRIHDEKNKCVQKIEREKKWAAKKLTPENTFRWSRQWKKKAQQIKDRDLNLCRVCITARHNSFNIYNGRSLSVHHIIPIVENYDMRLDDDNLITLCRVHHEMAEAGTLDASWLRSLACGDVYEWIRCER